MVAEEEEPGWLSPVPDELGSPGFSGVLATEVACARNSATLVWMSFSLL